MGRFMVGTGFVIIYVFFFFSSRRRHTRFDCDWSSDVCSSDLAGRSVAELPEDPEELIKLPGIGRYTAGAVACFAYEKPVPAVYTNVRRVLLRVFFGADRQRLIRQRFTSQRLTDRKSTRLNSSHSQISYAVFCLK